LRGAATLVGGTAASTLLPQATATARAAVDVPGGGASDPQTRILASDATAVVETTAGKVRGFVQDGIATFKGIPYAASTEGAGRFRPPSRPTPWTGVRSAKQYSFVCPQVPRAGWANDEEAWMFNWDDGRPGEDCLRVNVWTPDVNDHARRPVMVWLHGGGFQAGSGQELPSYHGERLSRRGDVVVVSLNHRLGVLGFLNLADGASAELASSANVGMLDLVAALEWVRDNIASFGGDPGNVTIFGQSGGGAKVSTLMAMPAAKGLFHKAIVQSGSSLRMATPEDTAKLAAATVDELDLKPNQLDKLRALPAERLIQAGIAASRKLSPPSNTPFGLRRSGRRVGWAPTVDGKDLPRHPFDPDAPSQSASIPMLIGTVTHEGSPSLRDPSLEAMTDDELKRRLSDSYGDKADRVLDAYRRAHPRAKPIEILGLITGGPGRKSAITQAARKAAQDSAPAYLYWFAWQTPVLDGRPRAFHCAELAFAFDNTDRCAPMTGGGPEPRELAAKVSEAWIHFARYGDPNHPGLPKWPAFKPDEVATMIFDRTCVVKNDPDRDEQKSLEDA
jgi:para-nitrobenzyl esterase